MQGGPGLEWSQCWGWLNGGMEKNQRAWLYHSAPVLCFPCCWASFYVIYYLSQFEFLLLAPEGILVGRGDKFACWDPINFWTTFSQCFKDRVLNLCWWALCVQLPPHSKWFSKTKITHNTPWLLDLAPSSLMSNASSLISSHTHQPLYHLSVTLVCCSVPHL